MATHSRRARTNSRLGDKFISDIRSRLLPAGILPFEKMAKKLLLQSLAVGAVEVCKMRVAVYFQPLLLGAGTAASLRNFRAYAGPCRPNSEADNNGTLIFSNFATRAK